MDTPTVPDPSAEEPAMPGIRRVRIDAAMACGIVTVGLLIDAVRRLVAIGS